MPLDKIDPLLLGITALSVYAYVSGEYIFALQGIIFQTVNFITLQSVVSRKFKIGKYEYLVRKLNEVYLFNDAGVYEENSIKKATPERAYVDMLHYNPNY